VITATVVLTITTAFLNRLLDAIRVFIFNKTYCHVSSGK